MKMYEIVDKDWPGKATTRYFHTLEEAEAHIENARRFDRAHPEESGGIPGREYLVIKIVDRAEQPCKTCGKESTNSAESYAKFPYCRDCYYVGNAYEDIHINDLALFRRHFEDAWVGIEHTGGGCFWLAFRWDDDPIYYCATAGEAELPDDDRWSDGWGIVCRYNENNDEDCEVVRESDIWGDNGPPTTLTKRQVIAAIKKDRKARSTAGGPVAV